MKRAMAPAALVAMVLLVISMVVAAQSARTKPAVPSQPPMKCPMCGQPCPMGMRMQPGVKPGGMQMQGMMGGMPLQGMMGGMSGMMGGMPAAPPPAVMAMDEHDLYLLRGNDLYKISKSTLKVLEQATLPAPVPPQGQNPPMGGMGMGAPGPGNPPMEHPAPMGTPPQ
jgi:hypothetical protein